MKNKKVLLLTQAAMIAAVYVILTELFVENVISIPVLISGVAVNAGVGLLVLFKTNKDLKENIRIVGLLYAIGIISGIILQVII